MYILLNNKTFCIDGQEVTGRSGRTYEIGDKIGKGGNSSVYECIDQGGDVLAIKILARNSNKSEKRFLQEISLLRRLNHPHIIRYVDEGTVGVLDDEAPERKHWVPFVVMEKADSNLRDYLKRNHSVPYIIYSSQFRGLCEALLETHKYAIHRDIKPENILIRGETWVLSDFGLCEFLNIDEHQDITGDNEKVGPIYWMSPEAVDKYYFSNNEIGTYSDVYQIGMIFAFVLLGHYPGGIIDEEAFEKAPRTLISTIIQALNNDKSRRPQNGAELLELINKSTIDR